MGKITLLFVMSLVGFTIFACAPKSTPVEKLVSQEAREQKPQIAGKEAWEVEWEDTLALARKEGKVVIYTTFAPLITQAFMTGFKEKHGISVEFVGGRGNELSQKLLMERRAGIYLADLYLGGATTIITRLKTAEALAPLEPSLILPEVKDPKAWFGGQLPWVDNEKKYILVFDARPGGGMVLRNTEMISPADLTSFQEFLLPRWKGKILMDDPTVPGKGNRWFRMDT